MTTTSSPFLLDANVLIALCDEGHADHPRAKGWLAQGYKVALCPISEGALVRHFTRLYPGGCVVAKSLLGALHKSEGAMFLPDTQSYVDLDCKGIQGHKQVTDSYLVLLARASGLPLATLDKHLAAIYPVDCHLIA